MRMTSRPLLLGSLGLFCLASLAASADHRSIRGRTGLPIVREGGENVWMQNGRVAMRVAGNDLIIVQEYRLKYPGPGLETGAQTIKVAVREDFYRNRDSGNDELATEGARGFDNFAVQVDNRRVDTSASSWELNDKKDTATRWREWEMTFHPGQARRLRITSRAPLGRQGNKPWVNFIAKDLAHWREAPDLLEVRLQLPGAMEARVAGLEPVPANINANAIRWVFRKDHPNRDIFVMLPVSNSRQTRR